MHARRKSTLPKLPQSAEEAGQLFLTKDPKNRRSFYRAFVPFDMEGNGGLLYITKSGLINMNVASEIQIDGTVETVPKPFYQPLTSPGLTF